MGMGESNDLGEGGGITLYYLLHACFVANQPLRSVAVYNDYYNNYHHYYYYRY